MLNRSNRHNGQWPTSASVSTRLVGRVWYRRLRYLTSADVHAYFNESIDLSTHVNMQVSSSIYQLGRVRAIRRSISTSMAIQLINSFVIFRLDYCNSLRSWPPSLLDGAHSVYSELRVILSTVGGIMTTWRHFRGTNVTGCVFLIELRSNAACWYTRHCMDRWQHTFDNSAPTLEVQRSSTLRSATHNHLILPRSKTKFGNRSFSGADLSAWNSLQGDIRAFPSLIIFWKRLKTHLFRESYISWHC